jgi:2-methylcitrate dehydratase PrpD
LQAFSPQGRVDVTTPVRAGREWVMPAQGLSIKRFPVCYMSHKAIDAALSVRQAHGVNAGDIVGITVETSSKSATILKHHRPQTSMEAKFSMEFAMAAAFRSGNVGLIELEEENVRRPEIAALAETVSISPYEDGSRAGDRVTVKMRDGRELSSEIFTQARGAWGHQLTGDELLQKFRDCLAAGRYEGDADALFDALMNLERLESADSLGSVDWANSSQVTNRKDAKTASMN